MGAREEKHRINCEELREQVSRLFLLSISKKYVVFYNEMFLLDQSILFVSYGFTICCFVCNRTEYRQYKMTVSPAVIAELTNTPRDLSLHTLFHDSVKVTQAVISSLTKETLDQRFYHDIAKTYRHCQQVATQQSRGRSDDSGEHTCSF